MTLEECLNRRNKSQETYNKFSSIANKKYIDDKTNVDITQEECELIILVLKKSIGMEIYNISTLHHNDFIEEELHADFTTQR